MSDAPGAAGFEGVDLATLESYAEGILDRLAFDYISGGVGDEVTLRANVEAWARLRIRPHVLRDMSTVDTSTTVLGAPLSTPVAVAPTAMHRFACEEGEPATARAAAAVGTLMVVSMAANTSLEDIASAAPGAPRWQQMYMLRDRGRTRALAERARDAGYQAIVASVDGAAVTQRRRLPGGGLVPPAFFRFPNLAAPDGPDDADLMGMVSDFDPSVTFDDLARFGEWSGLPVVVKAVLRGDDAAACVDAGARGHRRLEPRRPHPRRVHRHGRRVARGGRRRGRPGRGLRRRWDPQRRRRPQGPRVGCACGHGRAIGGVGAGGGR